MQAVQEISLQLRLQDASDAYQRYDRREALKIVLTP